MVSLTIQSIPISVTVQDQAPIVLSITGAIGIPPGGTTGQILVKKSDADYDVEWIDFPT